MDKKMWYKFYLISLFLFVLIPFVSSNGLNVGFGEEEEDIPVVVLDTPIWLNITVNSSNYWDGLDTPSDISTGDLTDDNTFVQTADWTTHNNYPANCNAGEYVYGIGDTLVCSVIPMDYSNLAFTNQSNVFDGNITAGSFITDYIYPETSTISLMSNVGIGTPNPITPLHLSTSSPTNPIITLSMSDYPDYNASVGAYYSDKVFKLKLGSHIIMQTDGYVNPNEIEFHLKDTEIMSLKGGTDDTVTKLSTPTNGWWFGIDDSENRFGFSGRTSLHPDYNALEMDNNGNVFINPGGAQGGGALTQTVKVGSDSIFNVFNMGLDRGGGVGGIGLGMLWKMQLENGAGARHDAGGIELKWSDPTAGAEDSQMTLKTYVNGAEDDTVTLKNGNVGINETNPTTLFQVDGAITARSYADYTDSFEGDAINVIKNIKSIDGKIDHSTLPDFSRLNVNVPIVEIQNVIKENNICENVLNEETNLTEEVCFSSGYIEVEEEVITGYNPEIRRVVNNQVTINVKALQQLISKIELLESELCIRDNTYSWC